MCPATRAMSQFVQARADVSLPDICLACGSARVVCGGKIAPAELAGNLYTELVVYYGAKNYVKQVISTFFSTSYYRTVQ